MGVLCFVCVYGVKILHVQYDAWLLKGDLDLMQHYIGWGHYRNDPWMFPFGLITSLSKPYAMSVVYTDSIPLMAVICKLLSPHLPETFQYFGLYGCISFALQGGLSMLLLTRVIRRRWLAVIASFFFILSFPVLQRMYYHTALASQWLILLSLVVWLYQKEDGKVLKKCLAWSGIGFLCVAIHSYFLPMAGAILLFAVIEQIIVYRKTTGKTAVAVRNGIIEIAGFCVAALLNLWLLGAFYGDASAIGGGIGTFESNLNTFYNPLGHGITGYALPIYNDFQYEGFAYLGLGMLMLTVSVLVGAIGLLLLKKPAQKLSEYIRIHHRQFLLAVLFLLFILLAAGPIYTFNAHRLVAIPLPGAIGRIADIFRSNGRMIWVSMYILMLAVFVCTDRMIRGGVRVVALVLALIIQIVDLTGDISQKQDYFNREQVYVNRWDDATLSQIIGDRSEFILMDDSSTMLMMDTAYYTYRHHMDTNRFYFARNIDEKIGEQTERYRQDLLNGKASSSAVYVFAKDGFVPAAYPELVCYEIGDHVMAVKPD